MTIHKYKIWRTGISNTLKSSQYAASTSRGEEMKIVFDERDNLEDEICGISHNERIIRRQPRRYSGSESIVNASTLDSTTTSIGEDVDIVAEIAE